MGIPSFFQHIVRRYTDILIGGETTGHKKDGHKCDRLFIDFNCILHKCAYEITTKYTTLEAPVIQKMIMHESIKYVNHIYDSIKPKELMYIAIDGVCPRAKMVQQRKRRYVSSWRKDVLQTYPREYADYCRDTNLAWDSNVITPGTRFMSDFDDLIKKTYADKPHVIISGSGEFGEGEHKIYEYMQGCEKKDYDDVIYGLDADIILLSIINLKENDGQTIRLMREAFEFQRSLPKTHAGHNTQHKDEFLYLNINRLTQSLFAFYAKNFTNRTGEAVFLENINGEESAKNVFARDYVVLCSLIGNDFLPPLSYLKVRNNGIDEIIDTYMMIGDKMCQPLVSCAGELNEHFFRKILESLMENEDVHMEKALKCALERRTPYTHARSYHRVFFDLDNYPVYHKDEVRAIQNAQEADKNWRQTYYQTLFHGDLVSDICENYVEGIQWVIDYYIKQKAMLDWYYRYSYAPTISDLYNFMAYELALNLKRTIPEVMAECGDTRCVSNTKFKKMTEDGFLQLFMVLPPSSAHLIPDAKKARVMTDMALGCAHLYPKTFKVTCFLKNFLWECSAILPDINITYLHDAITISS